MALLNANARQPQWFTEIFHLCGEEAMPDEARRLIIQSLEIKMR